MKKKRKIFFPIVIIVFISLAIAYYALKKEEKKPPNALPAPNIPRFLEEEFPIKTTFKKEEFNFPKEVPLLNLQKEDLREEDVKKIAANLGFSQPPITVDDVFDGKMHIYQKEGSSLTVSFKNSEFKYSLNEVPSFINKQLSKEALITIASKFLTDNGFVSPDNIRFSSIIYLDEKAGERISSVSKEKATFYQINFSSLVSDTTILTLNPKNTPVYVWLLPDGTVFKASVVRLGKIVKSENQYKLKSYEEVVSQINKAVLISLDEGNINLPDLPKSSIKEVSVSTIELAYLLDSATSTTLQPIYLLKGTAEIAGFSSEVRAFLYLPAVSSF